MKKYRRILAGFLAMNLTISAVPISNIRANASEEYSGDGNIQTDSEGVASEAMAYSSDESVDMSVGDSASEEGTFMDEDNTQNSDSFLIEENPANTETDQMETQNAEDFGEELSIVGVEEVEDPEIEDEAKAVNTYANASGTLHLKQFKNYKEETKSIDITSADELILLSNCAASELQDVEINLNITGTPDLTVSIKEGADISSILKTVTEAEAASTSNDSEQPNEESAVDSNSVIQEEPEIGAEAAVLAEDADGDAVQEDAQGSENDAPTSGKDSVSVQDDSSLLSDVIKAEQEYTFQGICTAEYPFQGKITGQDVRYKVKRAFFGGLSSSAQIAVGESQNPLSLEWVGDGTEPMIADVYQFDTSESNGHTLPVKVTVGTVQDESGKNQAATMGSVLGVVQAATGFETECLNITEAEVVYQSGATTSSVRVLRSEGNAGLICNTLKSGKICLNGYQFPQTVEKSDGKNTIESTAEAGNAGALIGEMEENTSLELKTAVTIPDGIKIASAKGNSGGLVGLMKPGAKITTTVEAAVTLNTPIITGGVSAGGVVGNATDALFTDEDLEAAITVKNPTVKTTGTDTSTAVAGGFIGNYTLTAGTTGEAAESVDDVNRKLSDQIIIDTPTLTVGNSGVAGGYFGYLDLQGKQTYTVGSAEDNADDSSTKKEIKPTYDSCAAEAVGAIAGKVTSNTIASTFLIQNVTVTATNSSNQGIQYHGGLIGELGTKSVNNGSGSAYLQVRNVEVSVTAPQVSESDNKGFGGLIGRLAEGSILRTENTVKVSTSGDINQGGGFVGYAEKSVIDLSGTTDLSGATYQGGRGKSAQTGWLVGKQESALIYAEGDGNGNSWSYIRGKENTTGKQAMNDIGNYGQIIRLQSKSSTNKGRSRLSSDLISINDNHEVVYKSDAGISADGSNITITSEDAFALLSIAWNTRGYFGGVSGITSDSFSTSSPNSKNITLGADIDLTGSGITGLSRDLKTDEDTYTGTFGGGNYAVTLAAGETFGFKQDNPAVLANPGDDGYGEVIAARTGSGNNIVEYHSRQGLFAKVSGATIQNLTVAGTIHISNAGADILAGGIAGEAGGDSQNFPSTSAVTVEEEITADCGGNTVLALGGFYGGSYSGEPQFGEINKNVTLSVGKSTIKIEGNSGSTDDTKIYAGGLIGEVNAGNYKLKANQVKIAGSIKTDTTKHAYVGGLVGIVRGGSLTDADNNNKGIHWMEIRGVTFDKFEIDAPNVTEMCGGLFGSIWANVCVYFMGENDDADGNNTKLLVKDATIKAPNAKDVGGLAYRSSGSWEIRDYGINLEKFAITAKSNVGLLVCKGATGKEKVAGVDTDFYALYLSTTKYWETSYKIGSVSIATTNSDVFDEFVAYTAASAKEITSNNRNGVISLATQDDGNGGRVGVDVSYCTTYQNRTDYGKNHNTNSCSRYYYDLDQCLNDMTRGINSGFNGNGKLDTPQELLLWSVYNYAETKIKRLIIKAESDKKAEGKWTDAALGAVTDIRKPSRPMIGETSGELSLNMKKYSYYPIEYSGGSVNVQNTTITFNNAEIEEAENLVPNKSTQGAADNHTQHYTMHCGLFLKYNGRAVFTVNNVTFSGSIGKINNTTSGVLVSDQVIGYKVTAEMPVTMNLTKIVLNGLKVNNCDNAYAPLLINSIGTGSRNGNATYGHTSVTINGITLQGYESGTPIASSLIGVVGSTTATAITMTFQGIVLPDKKTDGGGIFSHATLLESFAYDKEDTASGATYNFYSEEDWETKKHIHQVTYGKEITDTLEFKDEENKSIQKWYYNENTYGVDAGLVHDDTEKKTEFNANKYLPYVYTDYDADKCTHEIKVNQRVINITNGCGTYGHPFRITKGAEMNILSEYMSTGKPRKDWRVTITKEQNNIHCANSKSDYTSNQDATYQYDGTDVWVQVENKSKTEKEDWQPVLVNGKKITIGTSFMLDYLLNAYYDIQGTTVPGSQVTGNQMVLNDFPGLGTAAHPFRGVITSSNNTTIVLQGTKTGNGLIPYSYGSVVKKLNIRYTGKGKTLTLDSVNPYYPQICFGGVIGCVLGGDNIIDGVTVFMDSSWLTLSGSKKHLIQAGGYVGSVSGGGVIFRNMTDGAGVTNILANSEATADAEAETYPNLYVNPFVGRVLDGFAFYEKTSEGVDSLNNTNKNYKINTLTSNGTPNVTASENIVTVNDAQGLLLLSAIVNSGAASNGISHAYSRRGSAAGQAVQYTTTGGTIYSFGGKYGKVRNASYTSIGQNDDDAKLSVTEDKTVPGSGNLPYLIQKYCENTAEIFGVATNSKVAMNLSKAADFDMSGYENGYQGIGARYVSNAVRGQSTGDANPVNHPEGVVPELTSFNGSDKMVTMNMQVREYTDDDFHAASVGGVFNILCVNSNGKVSKLTIDQKGGTGTKPIVSLKYYDSSGAPTTISKESWNSLEDVGVGGMSGSLVGYTSENGNRDVTMEKIQLNELTVIGQSSTGGIVGNTGKPTVNTNSDKSNSVDISVLLQPLGSQIAYGIAFDGCSYKSLRCNGQYAAGGFAGYIGNKEQNPKSTVNETGADVPLTQINIGENSTIQATDDSSWAGGLFGYVNTRMFINMTDTGTKQDKTQAILQNVSVSAGTAAGGCIGYINEKCYGIHGVAVKGTANNTAKIYSTRNKSTTDKPIYAGGIVGYAKGANQHWTENWTYNGGISASSIENAQINNVDISEKHDYEGTNEIQTNYIAGGIIGQTAGGKTRIESCTVTSSDVYGSVAGGITGRTDSLMQFVNCDTTGVSAQTKAKIKGFSTAGGILGLWSGGNAATIQDCQIQYLDIIGNDWGVGALIGDADSKNGCAGILYLFNSSAQNSNVTAAGDKSDGGGRWPLAGGIIGNLRNGIKASNVLLSAIELKVCDGTKYTKKMPGFLFGNIAGAQSINISGISIQNISSNNENLALSGEGEISSGNSYIAFADYSGTAIVDESSTTQTNDGQDTSEGADATGASPSSRGTDLLGCGYKPEDETKTDVTKTDVASPYVVTSPKSTLALYESETDDKPKYPYGDGASWLSSSVTGSDGSTTTSFVTKAQDIYNYRNQVTGGHYAYKNMLKRADGSDFEFDFSSVISTFNKNQTTKTTSDRAGETETAQEPEDFPVLQIGSGSADTVTDYLDILTNGAFSVANALNKSSDVHVTAHSDLYEYKNGKFVHVKENTASPLAFKVTTDSNGKIRFITTTSYDNERNRFNLLTVTFQEKDADGIVYHYNVFVPILVRRMLEIDVTTTLTYGTDFKSSDYADLTNHVLESFGNAITGYLTYTYNSAEGKYAAYGWESYLNAGGNLMDMKKSVKFVMTEGFPAGTQMTLVDAESGKAYYYETKKTESHKDGGVIIPLRDFKDSDDNAYVEPSISELLNVQVEKEGSNPLFVKVDENGKPDGEASGSAYQKPTVRVKNEKSGEYEYYRLADSSQNEEGVYSITVAEDRLKEEKSDKTYRSTVSEEYYLVITVPKGAQSNALNGSIQTDIETSIPKRVHYQLRQGGTDKLSDTASTYQLSNGYQQTLTESTNEGATKEIAMDASTIKATLLDTITFPNAQAYNAKDQLYLRFVTGLQQKLDGKNDTAVTFPGRTEGRATFYVYKGDGNAKTYYTYNGTTWESGNNTKQAAMSYPWILPEGGNIELPLSTGQNADPVSLQEIRAAVKGNVQSGDGTFYMEVEICATIPTAGLDVIPETQVSGNEPKEYAYLNYSSQLSTVSKSLAYSNNRASKTGTTKYYRKALGSATLTYDVSSNKVDQLGINPSDPQYMDDKGNAQIDTVAVYDLSSAKNLESTLKSSSGIKFTLTLCSKNTGSGAEEYGTALTEAKSYIDMVLQTENLKDVNVTYEKGTWSWVIPKAEYDSAFDGNKLTQDILLKVNVSQLKNHNHYYSNYKVVLTAEVQKADGNNSSSAIEGTRDDDYLIYTLAKIKPEFVDNTSAASGN